MSDYDPGPGWRLTDNSSAAELIQHDRDQGITRMWVREAPAPPLPTEPYTAIRAWWGTKNNRVMCLHDGAWHSLLGNAYTEAEMAQVTRWEPLAEPRAVTAKAVLDRVHEEIDDGIYRAWLDAIAREFGVSS